jgi:hypothetical protein
VVLLPTAGAVLLALTGPSNNSDPVVLLNAPYAVTIVPPVTVPLIVTVPVDELLIP